MDAENISDPVLGELRWDSRIQWWEGRFPLNTGESFRLYIKPEKPERAISSEARQAISRLVNRDVAIRRRAAEGLLQVLNSTWNEGKPITADEFTRRMTPESIVVYAKGRADVSYNDDGMFWGHAIAVRIAPDGSFIESLIEG